MSGGAMTPPTPVPALMMPIAVARSFTGNHSATDARGRRETAAFADPEKQPARGERDDAAGEAVARAGERPENHDDEKPAPRAEDIQQPAAADIHEAVGEEKRGIEQRLDRIGNRDLAPNLADGDRQRLPVEIADRDGHADEEGDGPAELRRRSGGRWIGGGGHFRTRGWTLGRAVACRQDEGTGSYQHPRKRPAASSRARKSASTVVLCRRRSEFTAATRLVRRSENKTKRQVSNSHRKQPEGRSALPPARPARRHHRRPARPAPRPGGEGFPDGGVEVRERASFIHAEVGQADDGEAALVGVMAAQTDLVEVLGQFDPKLVKMCPAGDRAED